jgi:molybdopterin-binding protein
MEISARNKFEGTVTAVIHGAVNSEVTVEIAPGVEVVAIITKRSATNLGLEAGKTVSVVVKASNVMIASD